MSNSKSPFYGYVVVDQNSSLELPAVRCWDIEEEYKRAGEMMKNFPIVATADAYRKLPFLGDAVRTVYVIDKPDNLPIRQHEPINICEEDIIKLARNYKRIWVCAQNTQNVSLSGLCVVTIDAETGSPGPLLNLNQLSPRWRLSATLPRQISKSGLGYRISSYTACH